MTELSFAKSFLTTLDNRPSKISADHVEDPRNYPAQNAYILPRMPKPLPKPTTSTPSNSENYTITLLSPRNPPISLTLPSLAPTTSIHELKTLLAAHTSIPVAKLKILCNKRPVPDSKVLKDFDVEGGEKRLEFGVMVIGGAASVVAKVEEKGDVEMKDVGAATAEVGTTKAAPPVQGSSGMEVLESEEFWKDLEGYLMQRVRDEEKSRKLFELFRKAYENRDVEF